MTKPRLAKERLMLPASFTLSPSDSAIFCLSLPACHMHQPFQMPVQNLADCVLSYQIEDSFTHLTTFCCLLPACYMQQQP